jgi:hypothetical protein
MIVSSWGSAHQAPAHVVCSPLNDSRGTPYGEQPAPPELPWHVGVHNLTEKNANHDCLLVGLTHWSIEGLKGTSMPCVHPRMDDLDSCLVEQFEPHIHTTIEQAFFGGGGVESMRPRIMSQGSQSNDENTFQVAEVKTSLLSPLSSLLSPLSSLLSPLFPTPNNQYPVP